MLALYAAVEARPADAFGLGALPHLRLTVNDYPTWTYPQTASDKDKLLLPEHADDSVVTVAQEGDYEGLQLQGHGGDWAGVPVIPGALQVFSGHVLARWTDGRLRPGRHRVVAGGTVTRRSAAVFVYPALDQRVGSTLVWDHVKDRWRTTWPSTADPSRSPPGATASPTWPTWPRTPRAASVRRPLAPVGEHGNSASARPGRRRLTIETAMQSQIDNPLGSQAGHLHHPSLPSQRGLSWTKTCGFRRFWSTMT